MAIFCRITTMKYHLFHIRFSFITSIGQILYAYD
uniref:Uncharacterized protein n=1 Tax=Arundo donax TaxID=35708 RepID=A0A0A8YLL8_ARUDO